MIIKKASFNNRKRSFSLITSNGNFDFPYSKLRIKPSKNDPVIDVYVDRELGSRGFTYDLKSGREDSIMLDQVLEYNKEPEYIMKMMLYKLSVYAHKAVDNGTIPKREISRRMNTSPAQLYRLLNPENTNKTIDQMIKLLAALDCPVQILIPKISSKGQINRRSWERLLEARPSERSAG